MARFSIISKDGQSVRFEGKPRYIGSYLKPSYIEFSEIASPTPIKWEVGDYVDYPRTGLRYKLYSIPQASKNARKGSHGRAFTYSNVQLHAATKELEIALFRDLVNSDNNIHFSTSPDVVTFENVYGIKERIQACLDDIYPGKWQIRVASFEKSETIEKVSEAKDFSLSNGTCLDALTKIYELWEDIGWIHTNENGKDVITIGYAAERGTNNTTDSYVYGRGNGLTAIKKNQTNKDEFATRLYVYGSERNLPSRYYNGLNIQNAESVDIRNLMLPLGAWGQTNGLPDARKAYLENAEAIAKYGVIPKIHYFDSPEAGADIYPSIERLTIGDIRKGLTALGQEQYYPNESVYPDNTERIDAVLEAKNPSDDGAIRKDGKKYEYSETVEFDQTEYSLTIPVASTEEISFLPAKTLLHTVISKKGMGEISISPNSNLIVVGENLESVSVTFEFATGTTPKYSGYVTTTKVVTGTQSQGNVNYWQVKIPQMVLKCTHQDYGSFPVYLFATVKVTPKAGGERTVKFMPPIAPLVVNFERKLHTTFDINLKQIGFDIEEQSAIGEGKVISMKSGSCEARSFIISGCTYNEDSDSWTISCKRQQDNTLGILFPNSNSPIVSGDRFVLLDIAMPDIYIHANMERLLVEGNKLLAKASKVLSHYEPSIDAKVMIESGRVLREGMYMEISDEDVIDGAIDYILIDSLSIYEDEGAIPTYKVTLRERKKVTYKGTPSASSSSNTSSVSEESNEVNLAGYATEEYVDEKTKTAILWKLDGNTGGLYTEKPVRINGNVIVDGQISWGGAAEEEEGDGGGSTGEYRMFHYKQIEPAKEWVIVHSLGKMPNVRIIDTNKQLCLGDVFYISQHEVKIVFESAESGDAYLD